MENIDREKYKELNLILWDIHSRYIEPEMAFQMYERRWAYIDPKNILEEESNLIKMLTVEFGNNVFMPSM